MAGQSAAEGLAEAVAQVMELPPTTEPRGGAKLMGVTRHK